MAFKKISGDAFMQMDDSEQEEEYTRAVKAIRKLEIEQAKLQPEIAKNKSKQKGKNNYVYTQRQTEWPDENKSLTTE